MLFGVVSGRDKSSGLFVALCIFLGLKDEAGTAENR